MRLARMGSAFPTRLSFMRVLTRRLFADNAEVTCPIWELNDEGYGRAVYSIRLGGNTYSLVVFSTELEPGKRSDRVIAEAWDASFVLFDGMPSNEDMHRLEANVPKQEAGRFEASELVLSRANKSVRLFAHVVDRLSTGQQPDGDMIGTTGYLMRTTAVYGNGKLGIADRRVIADRPELAGPFQAEMLTVWLIRGFTHDLVEHNAKIRNREKYTPLAYAVKKNLGIGNSTGLGMAPFLIKHALLLNNWVTAREVALARVRAVGRADNSAIDRIKQLIVRARQHVEQWNVEDQRQMDRIRILRAELREVELLVTPGWLEQPEPWDRLINTSQRWSLECQELIVALVLEPYGELIDDLSEQMVDTSGLRLDPAMTVGELNGLLKEHYKWALDINFNQPGAEKYFWYTSLEKLEPRLGVRGKDPGDECEMPLDIARLVGALYQAAGRVEPEQSLAMFLTRHPQYRSLVRRVQASKHHSYSEICDNLIGADCMPLDILRFKLSFFGASKCDPKSNLWTRINMYQGAPLFEEIVNGDSDDWWLPVLRLQP
ncbi:MAG: hypothetical protein V3U76_16135 [Granulosicoccus sp.]